MDLPSRIERTVQRSQATALHYRMTICAWSTFITCVGASEAGFIGHTGDVFGMHKGLQRVRVHGVELRFYAGLPRKDVADYVSVSLRTVAKPTPEFRP